MSASKRKISRLPLHVFQDLITRPPDISRNDEPESLKSTICSRLKRFPVRGSGNKMGKTSTICSVKTIGQLLRLSKSALLLALDPILTYGVYYRRWICMPIITIPVLGRPTHKIILLLCLARGNWNFLEPSMPSMYTKTSPCLRIAAANV
jgi:hypothetical protein